MTARDNRGRFVSADVAAAERVLEAAVREAVADLRAVVFNDRSSSLTIGYKSPGVRECVRIDLERAALVVEPLLRSAS